MKKMSLIISLLLIVSMQARSWTEDYGVLKGNDVLNANDEQYRWLYVQILPEYLRTELPDEAFKSFRVHLQDSNKTFPKPDNISALNLSKVKKVQGTITYVGIVRKKYVYDLINSADQIILNVRVHLKNATAADKISFAEKMKAAAKLWNDSRILTDFKYSFKFDIVSDATKSHFSVRVLDTTRGPYDTNWGRDWTANVIAHEVGHMLGLGDEYQTISGKFDCLKPSLMCTAWSGHLMEHHYYFVLRRLLKAQRTELPIFGL